MAAKLQVELEVLDKATKELNSIGRSFNSFQNQIMAVGKAASNLFIGGSIMSGAIGAYKALMDEAKKFTEIQNQLRESLGYTSLELLDQSEALEKKYKVDDREIQRVQQRIALYTQDERAIKELTDATINYSRATGKDLESAVKAVDKAIVSKKGSIKGLGIEFGGAAESAERLTSISSMLNEKFHGQALAAAEAKTWIDKLKISLDNAKDAVAIGLFAGKEDRAAMRYKAAKEFIDHVTKEEASATFAMQMNYESELRIVNEYEKKMADAKAAAREGRQGEAIQKLNLTPEYKDEKEYQKAKQKETHDALKKQQAEDHWLNTRGLAIMREAARDDAEARYKDKQEIDKQYLDLVHADETALLDVQGENIKKQESAWKEHHIRVWDMQKDHDARMAQEGISFGAAFGSIVGSNLGKGMSGVKNVLRESLKMTIDYMEKKALAAATSNTFDNILALGPIGILTGMAQAAGIMALGEGAKAAISGFAMGTPSAPGGWSMVGENGPEMRYVPRGTQIMNSSETRNIMTNNNSGNTFHIVMQGSQGNVIDELSAQVRNGTSSVDALARALIRRAGLNA
jgi:hypothetical protein